MKFVFAMLLLACSADAALKGWPKEIREIKYRSAADDKDQPALHFDARLHWAKVRPSGRYDEENGAACTASRIDRASS